MLIKFYLKQSGHVIYGDNIKGKILGEDVMGNSSIITIKGVLLAKGLKPIYLELVNYVTWGNQLFLIALVS